MDGAVSGRQVEKKGFFFGVLCFFFGYPLCAGVISVIYFTATGNELALNGTYLARLVIKSM